jgi:hypothetical protein
MAEQGFTILPDQASITILPRDSPIHKATIIPGKDKIGDKGMDRDMSIMNQVINGRIMG